MTLYPKRSSAIGLLVLSLAFVAVGVWMGSSGRWEGWLCAAFFGLGVPIAVVQLMPGSTFLRIDADGITFTNLFRKTSLPWSAFQQFFVVTIRQTGLKVHDMVAFDFAPTHERARAARALSRAIAQCDGALPNTYGMKAQELAELLNARLRDARTR